MTRWASTLLVALIVLQGTPVIAQRACGAYTSQTLQLKEKYGESRRGRGRATAGALLELWASSTPPYTWTILVIFTNGMSCVRAAGDSWIAFEALEPGDDI